MAHICKNGLLLRIYLTHEESSHTFRNGSHFGDWVTREEICKNCKNDWRVCPREDQADVTHAISPSCLKLSQMIKVIEFGLPINPWGIRAFTSNPMDKIPKLALKFPFQLTFLTIIECSEFKWNFIQQFFKPQTMKCLKLEWFEIILANVEHLKINHGTQQF